MPMTGAQRVEKHRQRQKARIAELEAQVADLQREQLAEYMVRTAIAGPADQEIAALKVALDQATDKRIEAEYELAELKAVGNDGVYSREVAALAVGLDLTYTELMERALAMAAELEERDGRASSN